MRVRGGRGGWQDGKTRRRAALRTGFRTIRPARPALSGRSYNTGAGAAARQAMALIEAGASIEEAAADEIARLGEADAAGASRYL